MFTLIHKKRIIIISPSFFNVETLIIDRLGKNDNIVLHIDERPFKSALKKAINTFFPKFFLRTANKYFEKELSKCSFVPDVILAVKGELLSKKTISLIRSKYPNTKLILYLWDSIECVRGINKTIPLYDKVFSFDRKDCLQYGFTFRPLFCDNEISQKLNSKYEYDLCFYGTMHTDRFSVLTQVNKAAIKSKLKTIDFCYLPSRFMRIYYWLTNKGYRKFNKELLSFVPKTQSEISSLIANSKAILDINDQKQSGLTIRTLESLLAKKKIITTNDDIINYDFYDERNILIIDRHKVELPVSFFQDSNDDSALSDEIYRKYSVEGWIDDVFQEI